MKIAKGIISLALINQLLLPIFCMPIPLIMKVLGKIPTTELTSKKYYNLPKEYATIDYLNLASSIVNNNEIEGDCKYHSNATYEIYHKLVEQNGRKDLKDKINFILGDVIGDQMGHAMLEYTDKNGTRIQYETMGDMPKLEPAQVIEYSKSHLKDKTEEEIVVSIRTLPNSRIAYPTSLELLTYPGGAIRSMFDDMSKK